MMAGLLAPVSSLGRAFPDEICYIQWQMSGFAHRLQLRAQLPTLLEEHHGIPVFISLAGKPS